MTESMTNIDPSRSSIAQTIKSKIPDIILVIGFLVTAILGALVLARVLSFVSRLSSVYLFCASGLFGIAEIVKIGYDCHKKTRTQARAHAQMIIPPHMKSLKLLKNMHDQSQGKYSFQQDGVYKTVILTNEERALLEWASVEFNGSIPGNHQKIHINRTIKAVQDLITKINATAKKTSVSDDIPSNKKPAILNIPKKSEVSKEEEKEEERIFY